MSFLEKIFTKNPQKTNSNQAAFQFLDSCLEGCQKWFAADDQDYGIEVKKTVIDYVDEFGLEKSSKTFSLLPELKEAIADYFKRCNIKCAPENVVARSGIFELLQDLYQFLDIKNDQKILFALPISGYFVQQCYDNEIGVEFLNSDAQTGWKIDFAALQAALEKHKIRVLFLNYPNATSGAVLKPQEILQLAQIIKQHPDLLVIADESIRELAHSPSSIAAIDTIAEQIFTISSLKCYGLGSLDVAFATSKSKAIIAGLFRDLISVSLSNQHIAIAALKASQDNEKHLAETIAQCQENADLIAAELKEINDNLSQKFGKKDDFIKPISAIAEDMKAGNSILLQFSGLKGSKSEIGNKTLETDLDIAEFLKRETNIAMMPGQCCLLPEEEMILRLYLLKSKQELKAGFKKIGQAVMSLKMHKSIAMVNHSADKGGRF